jgi:hypothetical protein
MILLVGIPSESPMRMVASALDDLGHPYLMWNQRRIAQCRLDFEITGGAVDGVVTVEETQASRGVHREPQSSLLMLTA